MKRTLTLASAFVIGLLAVLGVRTYTGKIHPLKILSSFWNGASFWKAKALAATVHTPYTIIMTERLTEPNGMVRDGIHIALNRASVALIVTAVRGDGSTYKSLSHPESVKMWPTDIAWDDTEIIDYAKRRTINVYSMLNSKTTFPFGEDTATEWAAWTGPTPESQCTLGPDGKPASSLKNLRIAAIETVASIAAVHLAAVSSPSPAGDVEWYDQWLAPSLGCALVKSTTKTVHLDGSASITETEAERIIPGEPDPKLFEPQGDELKPSDSLSRRKQYFSHFAKDPNCPSCLDPTEAQRVLQQDEKYQALIAKYGPVK
jgi:hypothetical protein